MIGCHSGGFWLTLRRLSIFLFSKSEAQKLNDGGQQIRMAHGILPASDAAQLLAGAMDGDN